MRRPAVLTLPIGIESDFKGIIDLIRMKALIWHDDSLGAKYDILDIPEIVASSSEYRENLWKIVLTAMMFLQRKYLEGQTLSEEEIIAAISKGCISGKIIPTFCGSAFKNKGVQFLLDSVVDFMPSPLDVPPIKGVLEDGTESVRKTSVDEPFSALAFKIINDKYGQLSFLRAYSGVLRKGDTVVNMRTGRKYVLAVWYACLPISAKIFLKLRLAVSEQLLVWKPPLGILFAIQISRLF